MTKGKRKVVVAEKPRKVAPEDTLAAATQRSLNGAADVTPLVTLSTGVVLRITKFPKLLLQDVVRSVDSRMGGRPRPPVVFLADKGREEENPDDPDYQGRLSYYEAEVAMALNDAMMMRGTVAQSIPEAFPRPDDPDWLESEAALGFKVPTLATGRYLFWLKHVAAPEDVDVTDILAAVGSVVGVAEKDVAEATNRFRRE